MTITLPHKCFNCGCNAKYHVDTSQGVNCSDCSDSNMCEECKLDLEFNHVVSHESVHCSAGGIFRHKTKAEAVELFKLNNKPKTKHR